jgi:hypothetical protein
VPAIIPLAAPAVLLAAAVEAGGPAGEIPPGPSRTPIPLRQQVIDPAPPVPTPVTSEPPPPAPVIVPDGTAWTGEVLRKIREARGITLPQLAARTKVTRHHIENIEADRFGQLPAPVYLRGILMSLARELRLDGQKVARSYLDRAGSATHADGGVPIPRPR